MLGGCAGWGAGGRRRAAKEIRYVPMYGKGKGSNESGKAGMVQNQ